MLSKKDIQGGLKKYKALPADEKLKIDRQVEAMAQKAERHEEEKTNNMRKAMQDLGKEVGGYCNNVIVNGRITTYGGIGPGKKRKCSICSEHDSEMVKMADGNWYCPAHRSFWDLNKKEKELIKC